MKSIYYLLLLFSVSVFSQSKISTQTIDFDNNGIQDTIQTKVCGEYTCLKVILNNEERPAIEEQTFKYYVYSVNNLTFLHLVLGHCCGESPFLSHRVFSFANGEANLYQNYVLLNSSYDENQSLLKPEFYNKISKYGIVTFNNYNMRFAPYISDKKHEKFDYGCERNSNIIAKLKKDAQVKILSILRKPKRNWYFIEVKKNVINGDCNPITFDFSDQKLRGWISDKYIALIN